MKNLVFVPLVFAMAIAGPVGAQERPAEDAQSQARNTAAENENAEEEAAEPDPGDEVICRRERVTGSLTRVSRTCMTRNEWNAVNDRTRDEHGNMVRGAGGGLKICNEGFDRSLC